MADETYRPQQAPQDPRRHRAGDIFSKSGDSLLKAVDKSGGVHAALIDEAWYFIFLVVAFGILFDLLVKGRAAKQADVVIATRKRASQFGRPLLQESVFRDRVAGAFSTFNGGCPGAAISSGTSMRTATGASRQFTSASSRGRRCAQPPRCSRSS